MAVLAISAAALEHKLELCRWRSDRLRTEDICLYGIFFLQKNYFTTKSLKLAIKFPFVLMKRLWETIFVNSSSDTDEDDEFELVGCVVDMEEDFKKPRHGENIY